MAKHSQEFKLKVVQYYLMNLGGQRATANYFNKHTLQYDIGSGQLDYRVDLDLQLFRPHLNLNMLTPNKMYAKMKIELIA